MAFRVPVSDGSVIDVTLELKKNTSIDEINSLFKKNQHESLVYTEDPIVSSDIIGLENGSLVDGLSTQIVDTEDGQLVKVIAWYDNEMSYSHQMVRTAKYWLDL